MSWKITDETPYTEIYSRGTNSIVTQRKGYILRTSGDHNRLVRHDYRCPVHGVFEAMVSSGDVPDEMSCPMTVVTDEHGAGQCHLTSPWQYPTVNQGISAGSVKS